jgi:CHAD domain-containing protein
MRPNGSDNSDLLLTTQRRSRLVFNRISRHIGKLRKEAKSGDVHRFRTNSRRVEALVTEFAPESGNKEKLLKLLSRLRKKAGKLRDLDVQIKFLEGLKIPDRQNHRAALLDSLNSEQARRTRKLPKSFDAETARKLRKRLLRASSTIELNGVDPLRRALGRLPKAHTIQLNEKSLHSFRIAAKSARYIAELADSAAASSFVEELKKAQDAIGEWHDVLKLKEQAEKRFGRVHDSTLVAALNNLTHARFRRASNAAFEALANISRRYSVPSSKPAARSEPAAFRPESTVIAAA